MVDGSGAPIRVSNQALALTLVQNGRIAIPEIVSMVADVRRDSVIREHDLTVRRPPLGKGLISLRLRVAPLGPDTVLVLPRTSRRPSASTPSAGISWQTSAMS